MRARLSPIVLLGASLVLCLMSSAQAAVSTFSEPFDASFPQAWTAAPGALPNEPLSPYVPFTVSYAGGQPVTVMTIGGASAARFFVQDAPRETRFGYLSLAHLAGTIGEAEARINTLDQGVPYIDGLFELWLVNSEDHSKFVHLGMFGSGYDTLRVWNFSSSLEPLAKTTGLMATPPFAYQNNTWYRLRITQVPGRDLEVSIWNDAGDTRLVSHQFNHTLADLGRTFQVGFSQWMGSPSNDSYSLLCAVGSIQAWLAQ